MMTRPAPGRQPAPLVPARRVATWAVVFAGSAAALGVLWTAACGGHDEAATAPTPPTLPAAAFVGADVSALARIEQAGGVFRDSGTAGDAIAILRAHGATGFRLRVFVSPDDSDVQVNDLPYTVALARRVKDSGAKLLLDFHYSDTWADPGHQATPAAWAALGIDSLEAEVERYTDSVVTALAAAGAPPDLVQIGNEIDSGMLWPLGELYVPGADTLAAWTRFTDLLKAGIRGVHDALGSGDGVRIMLHYSQGGDAGGTQWFFDHMNGYGVPYDVIGLSYYPWWHGTMSALYTNLQAAAARYGKDVMVVETAYPWRAGGWESMVTVTGAMPWPATPQGQYDYMRALVATVASVSNGHGAGVVWWYPESIQVPALFAWGGGSLALFDSTGNLLPAAAALTTR